MAVLTIEVGDVRLTRVSYAEVDVPPEVVSLTADQVGAIEWADPVWANGTQPRVAAAAWIIESGDTRIVVDPAQAADDILRSDADAGMHQEAFATLLAEAGFARESLTHAVATHYDGIGMLAWRNDDGTWEKFFPNAPLLFSQREVDAIESGEHPGEGLVLRDLHSAGLVTTTGDHEQITRDVAIVFTGAHTPGHQIVHIDSQGERAVIVGHLAVAPLHLATGVLEGQHVDSHAAWTALAAIRDEGVLLIGPLWPSPGAGSWDGKQLVPASVS